MSSTRVDLDPRRAPGRVGHAWVAGEPAMATSLRRHLVRDRGFAKPGVECCGYWRQDRPAYD